MNEALEIELFFCEDERVFFCWNKFGEITTFTKKRINPDPLCCLLPIMKECICPTTPYIFLQSQLHQRIHHLEEVDKVTLSRSVLPNENIDRVKLQI